MPAKACVRSVPNPKSGRYEACSGPTSMWPRSLCPQGALDGSVRQLGALKIGPSLGSTFGLQDPASSSDCSVSPQPLGRPSPWRDRLRGGARGRLARGGSSPESGEVSRGRCGLLRCPAVRARGPRLPSLRAEQAANAESRAQQLSRSRAGTMGGESGAGQAQAGSRWGMSGAETTGGRGSQGQGLGDRGGPLAAPRPEQPGSVSCGRVVGRLGSASEQGSEPRD